MELVMKIFKSFLVTLTIALTFNLYAIDFEYPQTEQDMMLAVSQLNFDAIPKEYGFKNANQRYNLPEGWVIYSGEDARKLLFYINGADTFRDVSAVALSDDFTYQVIFSYFDEGYIDDSDWQKLDSDDLMKGVIESTTEGNEMRAANGVAALNVKGWVEEPTYDRSRDVVRYIIKAESEGESILNSVALKLGREGFTRITLASPAGIPSEASNTLTAVLDSHSFDDGFLYSDYEPGNRMAGIGLASLVALTAGSKNGKGIAAGLMATLLIFAKKLWFVIFLPFVFLWGKIKQRFGSK
tara:strand:+ start:1283 stop:2173 length:891 start_codon:yes stop_codon:yes gene_type:complete